jgi:hypothetical protein
MPSLAVLLGLAVLIYGAVWAVRLARWWRHERRMSTLVGAAHAEAIATASRIDAASYLAEEEMVQEARRWQGVE